jgi:hypothetical protein
MQGKVKKLPKVVETTDKFVVEETVLAEEIEKLKNFIIHN